MGRMKAAPRVGLARAQQSRLQRGLDLLWLSEGWNQGCSAGWGGPAPPAQAGPHSGGGLNGPVSLRAARAGRPAAGDLPENERLVAASCLVLSLQRDMCALGGGSAQEVPRPPPPLPFLPSLTCAPVRRLGPRGSALIPPFPPMFPPGSPPCPPPPCPPLPSSFIALSPWMEGLGPSPETRNPKPETRNPRP